MTDERSFLANECQTLESLEERRSSNRNLLRRFLQEVDEDTQATPSLRDREPHRRISRNTVPSLRDAMRQSIGGPGIMGDQVEGDESGVGEEDCWIQNQLLDPTDSEPTFGSNGCHWVRNQQLRIKIC